MNTIPRFAFKRVTSGQSMPGVFAVRSDAAIGEVVDDLLVLIFASKDNEWEGRVLYLPMR